MSASNWAACPCCTAQARKKQEDAMAALTGAGLNDGTFTLAVRPAEATFREDYEIYGAQDGTVVVSYGGSCDECGLSLSFRDEHPIPGLGDGTDA